MAGQLLRVEETGGLLEEVTCEQGPVGRWDKGWGRREFVSVSSITTLISCFGEWAAPTFHTGAAQRVSCGCREMLSE